MSPWEVILIQATTIAFHCNYFAYSCEGPFTQALWVNPINSFDLPGWIWMKLNICSSLGPYEEGVDFFFNVSISRERNSHSRGTSKATDLEKKLLKTPGVIKHSHPKILQSRCRGSTPAGRKWVPTKPLLSLWILTAVLLLTLRKLTWSKCSPPEYGSINAM